MTLDTLLAAAKLIVLTPGQVLSAVPTGLTVHQQGDDPDRCCNLAAYGVKVDWTGAADVLRGWSAEYDIKVV